MKKIIALLSLLVLVVGTMLLAGCGSDTKSAKTIALAFPETGGPWRERGGNLQKQLEESGFIVDIKYSVDEKEQISHIGEMLSKKPNCMVIVAINGNGLTEVLQKAKEEKVPVIAFDRLIMKSDAVSYYVTFDNEAVGNAMGLYIEAAMNLKSGAGPYNIEVFGGDPNDNNAHLFFSGAMKVLKPYIDKKQLICRSGELDFDTVAIAGWKEEGATQRMDKLFQKYYSGGESLDVILAPNDDLSRGIRTSLTNNGYSGIPIMTGQDAQEYAIKAILNGEQSMTVAKDANILSEKCIRMVKAVVDGTEPAINNVKTYNNGAVTVPSYLCTPLIVDKSNVNSFKK